MRSSRRSITRSGAELRAATSATRGPGGRCSARSGHARAAAAWPWPALAAELFKHRRVAELPSRPQVIFTSTDLGTGRAFRIARDFVGSYDHGYVEPAPEWLDLGVAVAASASFPMSFSIVWLATHGMTLRKPPKLLSLVDGGVYDNLGLEWFQGWSAGRPASAVAPDFKIVVNASGLLQRTDRKYGAVHALGRDLSVQYAQSVNLRTRWFIEQVNCLNPR
jgi:hypothetical protein